MAQSPVPPPCEPGPVPPQPEADTAQARARAEAGRLLFAQDCTFQRAVTALDQLPPEGLPEVAFVGRSNVGKSSLVNALTGRRTLARTSHTPGRTQQLIFFDLGHRLMLVDLPGYGYAKVSKSLVESWTQLMQDYLRGRVNLARVHLLVDGRHGLKPPDTQMLALLDQAAVATRVVLTKADKVKPNALNQVVQETEHALKRHPAAFPEVTVTSAEEGTGIASLREQILDVALPPQA